MIENKDLHYSQKLTERLREIFGPGVRKAWYNTDGLHRRKEFIEETEKALDRQKNYVSLPDAGGVCFDFNGKIISMVVSEWGCMEMAESFEKLQGAC